MNDLHFRICQGHVVHTQRGVFSVTVYSGCTYWISATVCPILRKSISNKVKTILKHTTIWSLWALNIMITWYIAHPYFRIHQIFCRTQVAVTAMTSGSVRYLELIKLKLINYDISWRQAVAMLGWSPTVPARRDCTCILALLWGHIKCTSRGHLEVLWAHWEDTSSVAT